MGTASKAKARLGLLLGGLAGLVFLLLFQLLRHPETALLFAALPSPAALVCSIRCVGVAPFLQVLGEAGKALLMIAISGFVLYALLRMARRILRTWALIERAGGLAVPAGDLPHRPGLEGVTVFESRQPLAFTAGFVKPRIFVSRELVERLDERELLAVLRHESHHRGARDPLKGLLISFVADLFFFLPVSRLLKNAYHLAEEMEADVRSAGDPAEAADLAGSLLRVRQLSGAGASLFFDPARERVKNLMGEPTRIAVPFKKLALAVVLLAMTAFIVLVPVRKSVTAMFLGHDQVCVLKTSHR